MLHPLLGRIRCLTPVVTQVVLFFYSLGFGSEKEEKGTPQSLIKMMSSRVRAERPLLQLGCRCPSKVKALVIGGGA